jgi:two-component system CheB/CheR fusion protein
MKEALERLPAADCDVLISDIGLPDGDGWELMRRLQLPRPIYAVAISGFGMSSDCARSRSVGYRHHLVKPYGVERLPEILEEAARERRRRDSRQRAGH